MQKGDIYRNRRIHIDALAFPSSLRNSTHVLNLLSTGLVLRINSERLFVALQRRFDAPLALICIAEIAMRNYIVRTECDGILEARRRLLKLCRDNIDIVSSHIRRGEKPHMSHRQRTH